MIFSRSDIPHLKWSVLSLLFALCLGGAAIVAGKHFVASAQREQHAAQLLLNKARSQLAAANEDRENMKAYTFEYGALRKRNIIGEDQRLDWIEGLEKIRALHRVADFKYSFAPQQPYLLPAKLDSGNFKLNVSEMTLQLDLLHEGQLMDFFDAMRTDIKGWFILDHCSLERSSVPDASVQLKAECTGGWLTLNNRNTK